MILPGVKLYLSAPLTKGAADIIVRVNIANISYCDFPGLP